MLIGRIGSYLDLGGVRLRRHGHALLCLERVETASLRKKGEEAAVGPSGELDELAARRARALEAAPRQLLPSAHSRTWILCIQSYRTCSSAGYTLVFLPSLASLYLARTMCAGSIRPHHPAGRLEDVTKHHACFKHKHKLPRPPSPPPPPHTSSPGAFMQALSPRLPLLAPSPLPRPPHSRRSRHRSAAEHPSRQS